MNIHDKSQQRGLAFIIAIILIFVIYVFSSPATPKAIHPAPITVSPEVSAQVDTPFTSPKAEADYFEKEANKQADIYKSRSGFISKMKEIDGLLDFSGNYDEDGDTADNTLSGDDKYNLMVQIMGSKKHVKEISFYYVPGFDGPRAYTLDDISKGVKIVTNQLGKDWASLFLAAMLADPKTSFKDSTVIGIKKLVIDYDADKSVDITITHK